PFSDGPAELEPVRLVLELEPRSAEAQDGAPIAHPVQVRGHLCHEARVAEGVRADHQSQTNLAGHHRPCREGGVPFPDRRVRVAEDGVQVIPGPEVLVAELVDSSRGGLERPPIGGLAPQEDAKVGSTRICAHAALLHSVSRATLHRLAGQMKKVKSPAMRANASARISTPTPMMNRPEATCTARWWLRRAVKTGRIRGSASAAARNGSAKPAEYA